MRAFDQCGVERYHVHQITKAQLLLHQLPGDARFDQWLRRIQKQFDRVIAWFAMDIHSARIVGRARVVQKMVISEPAVGARDRHQFAGTRMIQTAFALPGLVEHALDAGQGTQQVGHLVDQLRPGHVDVRDLVIGERERIGCAGIKLIAPKFITHPQPAGLTQRAIDMHRPRDRSDAVLRKRNHMHSAAPRSIDQLAADFVHLGHVAHNGRMRRTEALQVVIQMRQIHQRQCRLMLLQHMQRRLANPARGNNVSRRPPEAKQWKLAEFSLQFVAQSGRVGMDIGQLAPIGRIHRSRRDRKIGARVHVVPPEQLGTGERRIARTSGVPEFLSTDQTIRLAPEPDFGQIAEVPAVADDAVIARQQAGHKRGLHRRGHRRYDGAQGPHRALSRQRGQMRSMRQQGRRHTDYIEHQGAIHESLTWMRSPEFSVHG